MSCSSKCRQALCVALTSSAATPLWSAPGTATLSMESLLETTVTSASKYAQRQDETAAAVSVITRSQIKAFGWRTLDQALASLPGIHTTYDRQYTYLGTRGFGLPGDFNTRIMLAINGNRLNNVVYDSALIGREFPLDMDLVDRIEFIAGPGGAVYGQNAMFGVINVITRTGSQIDGGEASTVVSNKSRGAEGRVSWGKLLENDVDLMFSASGLRAKGQDLPMHYPGASESGADVRGIAYGSDAESDQEFMARIARGAWSFDLSFGDRNKDDPTGAYLAAPLAEGQYERDVSKLAQLTYRDNFARDSVIVSGRLFWGQELYSGLFRYPASNYFSTGTSQWQGAEFNVLYQGFMNHKFLVGMELQDNVRIEQVDKELSALVPDKEILDSGHRTGVYVQHEWQLSATLASTLGLRLDRNDVTGTKASPRAALIWQAAPTTTFKTLYGRAHRAPNAYEKDYQYSQQTTLRANLDGEIIDTYELLVDQRMSDALLLRASVYQWTMQNILTLVSDPLTGSSVYEPGEKVEAEGVELSALMSTSGGYSLTASLARQDVAYESGGALPNSPKLIGKFNLAAPLPWAKLLLAYEAQYIAKRLTGNGSFAEGYWLSNLNLSSDQWIKRVGLSLSIRNILDERYEHPAAESNWQNTLTQDARSVQFRVDYRF